MVENSPTQKEFPPFKPMAYFGGNLLLGGLSYVLLRQYVRFFIFFGLIIISSFIPLASYVVMIGSAFDAYSISKKLKAKQISEPQYSNALTWTAMVMWALMIFLALGGLSLLIGTPI